MLTSLKKQKPMRCVSPEVSLSRYIIGIFQPNASYHGLGKIEETLESYIWTIFIVNRYLYGTITLLEHKLQEKNSKAINFS